ncbi:MAG: CDP-diacylglycerol--glycerol-3-phosphate 3-phosphatidyltransferase [Rickettsiales bacterium]|jgi:CDP-diacylglycerol--glycerol-3-phosphate 3-phosphatidyltransferase|nr:CDP-diacylglycerol--glycerol-3-phosphate 3-phosphatidyltransferase [Rickettsiales bacterium]
MLKHIPNILTASRIISIPLIIIFYHIGGIYGEIISSCLFLLACITDFLDGYLARTYSIQSKLGKFLDPIADKLLIGSVMLILVYYKKADLLPAIAIICREILVSGLREFLAEIRVSIPVSNLAKIKTGFQMSAMFMLLVGNEGSNFQYMDILGSIALWIAAGLTLFTGYVYLRASIKHLD